MRSDPDCLHKTLSEISAVRQALRPPDSSGSIDEKDGMLKDSGEASTVASSPPSRPPASRLPVGGATSAPAAAPLPQPVVLPQPATLTTSLGSPEGPLLVQPSLGKKGLSFAAKEILTMQRVLFKWEVLSLPFGDVRMTRLLKACAVGDVETVGTELERLSRNTEALARELAIGDDWAGSSALHWAAYGGVAACVEMVLDKQADVYSRNKREGALPIHLAARYGNTEILASLVDAAPDTLLARNVRGRTPLHESTENDRALRFLIEQARSLKASPSSGQPVIPTLSMLLEMTTLESDGGYTPLLAAVELGRQQAVRLLIDASADLAIAPLSFDHVLEVEAQTVKGSEPVLAHLHEARQRALSAAAAQPIDAPPAPWRVRGASSASLISGIQLSPQAMASKSVGSKGERNMPFWHIEGHGAISLALSAGHLDTLVLLLESSHYPPIFSVRQLQHIVLGIWCSDRSQQSNTDDATHAVKWNARLFATLVLCANPDAVGSGGGVDGGGGETAAVAGSPSAPSAAASSFRMSRNAFGVGDEVKRRNPCLVALQLSTKCERATVRVSRDRLRVARLREAEMLLELVAGGLVHCADRDGQSAAATRGYNMWRMGTQHVHPIVARDVFVCGSADHAAEYGCKIFIAQPLVYEHVHDLFWPTARPSTASGTCGLVTHYLLNPVFNLLALPFLPLLPRAWEQPLLQHFRQQHQTSGTSLMLLWLYPCGRVASWFLSMLALALLLTFARPHTTTSGPTDLLLLAYLAAITVSEYQEAMGVYRLYRHFTLYLYDPFTVLDLMLVVQLALLLIMRHATSLPEVRPEAAHITWDAHFVGELEIPCQALAALICWLRLLEVLFVFSKTGPLLLMAIHTLDDLWQFLMLAAIIIMAFACAFFVLLSPLQSAEQGTLLAAAEAAASDAAGSGSVTLTQQPYAAPDGLHLVQVLSLLINHTHTHTHTRTHAHTNTRIHAHTHTRIHAYTHTRMHTCMCMHTCVQVIGLLITAAMKGEPDHIMLGPETELLRSGEAHDFTITFASAAMYLFGVVVVLLLLNLLIARFAKTFDIISENVDAHFKVRHRLPICPASVARTAWLLPPGLCPLPPPSRGPALPRDSPLACRAGGLCTHRHRGAQEVARASATQPTPGGRRLELRCSN